MSSTITPKFRVSFPNVFKPKLNTLSNKEEYSLVALFPKGADLTPLKVAAEKAIVDKWGPDKAKWPKNLRSPFRDQGERAKEDEVTGAKIMPAGYEEGGIYLNLKSKNKPGIVDQNRQDIIAESDFYAGCYARASVSCYAYDQAGNRGVSFGLTNLQKMGEGDPLSGRPQASEEFSAIEGVSSGGAAASVFGI